MEYSCIFIIMLETYIFRNVYRVSESVIVISKLNEEKRRFRKLMEAPLAEGTRFTENHVRKTFLLQYDIRPDRYGLFDEILILSGHSFLCDL
jgi:hypothetical protein